MSGLSACARLDPRAPPPATGREEEWRFTPLDRIRVLLDGAPSDAHLDVTSDLPDGVELVAVPVADLDLPLPVDRLAALARRARATPWCCGCPRRSKSTSRSSCT